MRTLSVLLAMLCLSTPCLPGQHVFSIEGTHLLLKNHAYTNYSRIGRYTAEMKEDPLDKMRQQMAQYSGYVFASTWLQCGQAQGIEGPFTSLGGRSNLGSNKTTQAAWNLEQPRGESLDVTWSNGCATVEVPPFALYAILEIRP